jgi:hypothetical protein
MDHRPLIETPPWAGSARHLPAAPAARACLSLPAAEIAPAREGCYPVDGGPMSSWRWAAVPFPLGPRSDSPSGGGFRYS